jgi:protein-S-isoprenylcysteine O-methyltransferase Ste14
MKQAHIYTTGVLAQIAIILSLLFLEIGWGAIVQRDLFRGIYCAFFFVIFAWVMFDLYVLGKRKTTLRTTGPFAVTRHPVYVCLFMISQSYWFADDANLVIIAMLELFLWSGLLIASLAQERLILEKFGVEAKEYYERTPRFIFF